MKQTQAIIHCPLCRQLYKGRRDSIADIEFHKKEFTIFVDPDFGSHLCFHLSIKCDFFPPWHVLFFIPFIFMHSPTNLHCFIFQHNTDFFHLSNQILTQATLSSLQPLYSKKTVFFLLIITVKE